MKKIAIVLTKVMVTIALLAFAFHSVNFSTLLDILSRLRFDLVMLVIVLLVVQFVIAGGTEGEDIDFLNGVLFKRIASASHKPFVYIHVGEGDHHYKGHVIPLINVLKEQNAQHHLDLHDYSGHDKTAEYFPMYLQKVVSEILDDK